LQRLGVWTPCGVAQRCSCLFEFLMRMELAVK